MNPEDQNQPAVAPTDPQAAPQPTSVPPQPTPAPGLGVTPPPADPSAPAAAQPTEPNATMAPPRDTKSKLPFLLGVGLVAIVLIAAIVFLVL